MQCGAIIATAPLGLELIARGNAARQLGEHFTGRPGSIKSLGSEFRHVLVGTFRNESGRQIGTLRVDWVGAN